MTTPKLLSRERLARIFDPRILASEKHEILGHIAALEADNAALLDRIGDGASVACEEETVATKECGDCGPCHDRAILSQHHPGAALLEEHRKALARARNEGLEKARIAVVALMEGQAGGVLKILSFAAKDINALKEPEE